MQWCTKAKCGKGFRSVRIQGLLKCLVQWYLALCCDIWEYSERRNCSSFPPNGPGFSCIRFGEHGQDLDIYARIGASYFPYFPCVFRGMGISFEILKCCELAGLDSRAYNKSLGVYQPINVATFIWYRHCVYFMWMYKYQRTIPTGIARSCTMCCSPGKRVVTASLCSGGVERVAMWTWPPRSLDWRHGNIHKCRTNNIETLLMCTFWVASRRVGQTHFSFSGWL